MEFGFSKKDRKVGYLDILKEFVDDVIWYG